LVQRDVENGRTHSQGCVDLTQVWLTPADTGEFLPGASRLATIASDRSLLKLWNSGTGQLQATPEKLEAPATYLGWSRDGRCISATGYARDGASRWREVKVWDASSGAVLFAFTPAPGPLRFVHGRVAVSPDGSLVAFDDYEDAEIDAATGEPTG